jgi:hypothetical protein
MAIAQVYTTLAGEINIFISTRGRGEGIPE